MPDQRNSRKKAVANVIKQANQQVALGDIQSATDILLKQIVGKKHRDWKKEYEQLMLRLFELCVERRDAVTAKDAIHNYRNMCQHHDPNSLDIVVTHMFDIAEQKLDAALRSCEVIESNPSYFQSSLLDSHKEEEEEEEKAANATDAFKADPFAPETLLLSAVGMDDPPSLYRREQIVPWTRFLFNIYRGLLDALQRNIKLERVYHHAAQRLFKFCIKYERSSDLHRLVDVVRNHFTRLGEYIARQGAGRSNEVEWSMTTLNYQLESRLYLLEAFSSTGASHDAVRVIPQIAEIIRLSEGDLPSRSQARRFLDCAAKVYLDNKNYLLHACCLIELQSLCSNSEYIDHSSLPDYTLRENAYWSVTAAKKLDLSKDGKAMLPTNKLTSLVVVASLSVPSSESTLFGGVGKTDEVSQLMIKTQATSYLLGLRFSQPSREVILSHLTETDLASSAPDFAQTLFRTMKDTASPLELVQKIAPLLEELSAHPLFVSYMPALKDFVMRKFMLQMSTAFNKVTISFLVSNLSVLGYSRSDIERVLVTEASKQFSRLVINDKEDTVEFTSTGFKTKNSSFASAGNPLVEVSNHLVEAADRLKVGLFELNQQGLEGYIASALDHLIEDRLVVSNRVSEIERRHRERDLQRDFKERLRKEKEKEDQQRLLEEEKKRVEEERRMREKAQRIRERHQEHTKRAIEYLKKYNASIPEEELNKMNRLERKNALRKARDDFYDRMRESIEEQSENVRKVDYQMRAVQRVSFPFVYKYEDAMLRKEEEEYNQKRAAYIEHREQEKAQREEIYAKLSKVSAFRESYEANFQEEQKQAYEADYVDYEQRVQEYVEEKLRRAKQRMQQEQIRRKKQEEQRERERIEEEKREQERKERQEERDRAEEERRNSKFTSGGGVRPSFNQPEDDWGKKPVSQQQDEGRSLSSLSSARQQSSNDDWNRVGKPVQQQQQSDEKSTSDKWSFNSPSKKSTSSSSLDSRSSSSSQGWDRGSSSSSSKPTSRSDNNEWSQSKTTSQSSSSSSSSSSFSSSDSNNKWTSNSGSSSKQTSASGDKWGRIGGSSSNRQSKSAGKWESNQRK